MNNCNTTGFMVHTGFSKNTENSGGFQKFIDSTLAMMQHIMLLLYRQRYFGQSPGGIFDLLN